MTYTGLIILGLSLLLIAIIVWFLFRWRKKKKSIEKALLSIPDEILETHKALDDAMIRDPQQDPHELHWNMIKENYMKGGQYGKGINNGREGSINVAREPSEGPTTIQPIPDRRSAENKERSELSNTSIKSNNSYIEPIEPI